MTIKIQGFVASTMYFVLGLITYMLIGGYTVFAWTDPWVYVYMAFWPFILIWYFFLLFMIVFVIGLLIYGALDWYDRRHDRARRKENHKRLKKR